MLWPIGQPVGDTRTGRAKPANLARRAGHRAASGTSGRLAAPGVSRRRGRRSSGIRQRVFGQGEARRAARAPEVRGRAHGRKAEGLKLALWSPREVCVDPREVSARLAGVAFANVRRRIRIWIARSRGRDARRSFGHDAWSAGPPLGLLAATNWSCSFAERFAKRPGPLQAPDDEVETT